MNSSIMIDLDDEKTAMIAEILSNKTCKKILGLLAEKEMSAGDLSEKMGLPLNTIGYNLDKLVESGLIEKSKNYFWSVKGKRVVNYKISNKRIIIMPKKIQRGIIPAIIGSALLALGIKTFYNPITETNKDSYALAATKVAESGASSSGFDSAKVGTEIVAGDYGFKEGIYHTLANAPNYWAWFLIGALTALLIVLVWNWSRNGVKGG